ncbi:MAG TPA: 2Fe-2S iron-sulfur cluster-binding protein, partial [Burkholderiales bacterium]|nr:2Fe-2S iron-sulfur cluster-binding protein [Burkholderiales bacterium]
MRKEIRLRLNGQAVSAQVAPHENLVEVLQENFGLYGARESCGQGMCGCCTVLVNGRAVSGCLYLATLADQGDVQTIENNSEPDAVQRAFVEASAFQCGFC